MIAPVPLTTSATVYIDDDLMVAKLQPSDLHVIAGIDGRAMRGDSAIELLGLQRLAHGHVETFLARWQGLNSPGKFTRDVADQV